MTRDEFYKVLMVGKMLWTVRAEHTPELMHLRAEIIGMSKRNAKRYARIANRFYDWDKKPAKSIRALDELASCKLVRNVDIARRTRKLGKLMNTKEARKLVVDCIVRDEPILALVLPYGGRVATHKEVTYWKEMLKCQPVAFARQAFCGTLSRRKPAHAGYSQMDNQEFISIDYNPDGGDDRVNLRATTIRSEWAGETCS